MTPSIGQGQMHPPSRRGATQSGFSHTGRGRLSRPIPSTTADTARHRFGPMHDVIKGNQLPCESALSIPEPRPTKPEGRFNLLFAICYLLFCSRNSFRLALSRSPEQSSQNCARPG
jgi:hypothetical protein